MTLSVLLADDHGIVRQGLRALLTAVSDFHLAGEAADGSQALRLAEQLQPDILVLDLMLSGRISLDAVRQVVKRCPKTRIIILSMHSNEAYVLQALRAGASGYVLKEAGAEELVNAIRTVSTGKRYLSSAIPEESVAAYEARAAGATFQAYTLTLRERQILQLTAEGLSGNEISERLFISPRTVETHQANLRRKLGLRNQKELVRYALQRGSLS
jgi:two-component system response regulator NreC